MDTLNKDNIMTHKTLHTVDEDLNTVTIKISSQTNAYTGMIKDGSIIKLLKFTTLFFDYKKATLCLIHLFYNNVCFSIAKNVLS